MKRGGNELLEVKKMVKFVFSMIIISFVVLTGSVFGEAYANIPAIEREALIALYKSTNGDNWGDNSGWKDPPLNEDGFALPGTECSWRGVYCTDDNVTTLYLWDNQLPATSRII
jgi:hypothetical protein